MAKIKGGAGYDSLVGGSGSDSIHGFGGDDWLQGGKGNDYLSGGDGADRLFGGLGNDKMNGGNGNDKLYGGSGNDRIYAYAGNDTINAGAGNDTLYGGDGNDTLLGLAGNDRLDAGNGNDRLEGGDGIDTLWGGNGNDWLLGGLGNDVFYGDAGIDWASFEAAGSGTRADLLISRAYGGEGSDRLYGIENVLGSRYGDTLQGNGGANRLQGGDGNDTIYGDAGNDTLEGGNGVDRLDGGNGRDTLDGGAGADTLTGGADADTFRFTSLDGSIDHVKGYDPTGGDILDLSRLVPNLLPNSPTEKFIRYNDTTSGLQVAVDPGGTGKNFQTVAVLDSYHGTQKTPIADPIPGHITKDGLAVEIHDFVSAPTTASSGARANVNWLYHADDGSNRLFLADSRGQIYLIESGKLNSTPFLDVKAALGSAFDGVSSQMGLRSFAFHPDFEKVGSAGYHKIFTATTEKVWSAPSGVTVFHGANTTPLFHDVVSEWTVSAKNPNVVDPTSQRELFRVEEPLKDHNIDQVEFNPNAKPGDADYGKLYIGFGDGGNQAPTPDAYQQAQNPLTPLGSILRIDPLQHGKDAYSIPSDNPFVGKTGYLPEIWAYGFRHPQRFSWDEGGDHKMIIGDIGQAEVEEINIGKKGANYGWSDREGTFVTDHTDETKIYALPADDAKYGYTYPVAMYDHDEGSAIVGGFVYRGSKVPALQDEYIFGDIVNGRIFHVSADALKEGQQATIHELTLEVNGKATSLMQLAGQNGRVDLRFGEDEKGEIYVLTKQDGMVRSLAPSTVGTTSAHAPTTLADPEPDAHIQELLARTLHEDILTDAWG